MNCLLWKESACLSRMLASGGRPFFRPSSMSMVTGTTGCMSSATHLLSRFSFSRPYCSLRTQSRCRLSSWKPSAQTVCRKCLQGQNGRSTQVLGWRPVRRFAESSRLRNDPPTNAANNAGKTETKGATIPKSSEIKKLLSQARPERWRILGEGNHVLLITRNEPYGSVVYVLKLKPNCYRL